MKFENSYGIKQKDISSWVKNLCKEKDDIYYSKVFNLQIFVVSYYAKYWWMIYLSAKIWISNFLLIISYCIWLKHQIAK